VTERKNFLEEIASAVRECEGGYCPPRFVNEIGLEWLPRSVVDDAWPNPHGNARYQKDIVTVAGADVLPAVSVAVTSIVFSPNSA
jgi:hypothetical protein